MFKNQSIQPTAGFYSEGIATNFLNEKNGKAPVSWTSRPKTC